MSDQNEAWVVVYRSGNQMDVSMAMDRLRAAEIPARAIGTQNAALLGAAEHIFAKRIEVLGRDHDAAVALLADQGELAEPLPDELREDDDISAP